MPEKGKEQQQKCVIKRKGIFFAVEIEEYHYHGIQQQQTRLDKRVGIQEFIGGTPYSQELEVALVVDKSQLGIVGGEV